MAEKESGLHASKSKDPGKRKPETPLTRRDIYSKLITDPFFMSLGDIRKKTLRWIVDFCSEQKEKQKGIGPPQTAEEVYQRTMNMGAMFGFPDEELKKHAEAAMVGWIREQEVKKQKEEEEKLAERQALEQEDIYKGKVFGGSLHRGEGRPEDPEFERIRSFGKSSE